MLRPLSREIIEITPLLAENYIKLNTFSSQRYISEKHVQVLSNKMKQGRFRIGSLAVAIDQCNGFKKEKRVLMNGQHQLHAVMSSGQTIEVLLEKYICKKPQELSELFRQFDNHYMRSISSMIKVEADVLMLDVPLNIASLVVSAVAYLKGEEDKDRKVELLQHNIREANFINEIIRKKDKPSDHLRRKVVVAAMINTFRVDEDISKKFWKSVRDGEMLRRKMPQFYLREFLLNATMSYRDPKKIRVTDREMYYKCVKAWNHFRNNKQIKTVYYRGRKSIIPDAK